MGYNPPVEFVTLRSITPESYNHHDATRISYTPLASILCQPTRQLYRKAPVCNAYKSNEV